MGKGAKGYMSGEDCFYDKIPQLKDWARETLEENESRLNLADEDFVFWMSQSCMFCFFKLDEGDNPPVYLYNENGEDAFVKIQNSLTDFLEGYLTCRNDLFKAE